MTTARSAPLSTLRKAAQALAAERKERLTTIHLLAIVARRAANEDLGPDVHAACTLLAERRLTEDVLLRAARAVGDESPEVFSRVLSGARDIAKRANATEPGALHVVLALLADRNTAAHRALVAIGTDVAKLRAAALQVVLGVVAARRSVDLPAQKAIRDTKAPAPRPTGPIPAAPPDRRTPAPPKPPPSRSGPAVLVSLRPPLVKRPPPEPAHRAGIDDAAPGSMRGPTQPPHEGSPNARRSAAPQAPMIDGAGSALRGPSSRTSAPTPARIPEEPRRPAVEVIEPTPAAIELAQSGWDLDRRTFPLLAIVGKNLTALAATDQLAPAIGRDAEIDALLDVLARRNQNSALLIGAAGVGKTTIAHGVAERWAKQGRSGAASDEARALVEIVFSELVAGTGLRGALAERLASIVSEVKQSAGRVVLFIDEIHEVFAEGAEEAAAVVKLALGRGDVQIIGATTPEEMKKRIEPDAALGRRFSVIEVEEPSEEGAFALVRRVADDLGSHHGARYTDDAVKDAIAWSVRYLPGRALPDKAISVLDLAGARARRRLPRGRAERVVESGEVASVVSEVTGVPAERLLQTDGERLLHLEEILAERVVGHGAAIGKIARVLRRNGAGLRGRRPIGSFLLLGPTGVGKTETAKAIAEALFHSPDAMTRLDLSEYAEAHAIARLVGAPPGYLAHEAGGQLTESIRKRPYQVLLLDEIEKAHQNVLLSFLQVLDEGRMTDGRGRLVDFTNTVIVMTSNLGSAEAGAAMRERPVGFARSDGPSQSALADVMLRAARAALAPELYNRVDEILCFSALTRKEVAEVARRMFAELGRSLTRRGIGLSVDDAAIEALLDAGGFDPALGARPMRRALARLIEAPLAELILSGALTEGGTALVTVEADGILVDAVGALAAE